MRRLLPFIAFACVYVVHFAVVWRHAVNVPFWDEWDVLPEPLSLRWLYDQHNEHRLVFTKLEIWALANVGSWNLVAQQVVNFVLFGALLAVVIRLVSRAAPALRPPFVLAFAAFLLSPLNHENHAWAFQSQVHFALVFLFLAIDQIFLADRIVLGALLAVCGMYSFSSGVVAAMAIAPVVVWHARRRALAYLVIVGAGAALWFAGLHRDPAHQVRKPVSLEYWEHYANVVAMGFGWDQVNAVLGVVVLVLAAAVILYVPFVTRRQAPLPLLAAILAVFAMAAGISYGRAAFGPGQAKASRYAELMGALPLLLAAAWACVPNRRVRFVGVAAIFTYAFAGFADDWSFAPYAAERDRRLDALACLRTHRAETGPLVCESAHPEELRAKLERAVAAGWRGLNE